MSTPCIIITRDRVSYTRRCVASLEPYNLDIHIVDHGSTWGPMLEYLEDTPHVVHRRHGEFSPHSLWEWDGLANIASAGPYLVTDPDVVLDDACPADWLAALTSELTVAGGRAKVGLGLRLDDLPDTPLAASVRAWEVPFWDHRLASGKGFHAPVDTTLALYRPLTIMPTFTLVPAARLDAPYLLRHLPWYGELDEAETKYYREHLVPGSSHWINGGW
jgi:hypothetical protein